MKGLSLAGPPSLPRDVLLSISPPSSSSSSSSTSHHQCGFAAHCLLHSDLSTLRHCPTLLPPTTRHTAGKKSEQEEGEGWSEPPLKAVLDFPPSAFRWHSYIRNGCVYSLSYKLSPSLSTLEALRKVPCIQVTDDVSFELIGCLSRERRDITCVADVAEILSKFHLPKLSTAGKTEPKDNQRSEVAELVTFRGVILKHGYRIDHESLSSSTSSSSSHPSHLLTPHQYYSSTSVKHQRPERAKCKASRHHLCLLQLQTANPSASGAPTRSAGHLQLLQTENIQIWQPLRYELCVKLSRC